MLTQPPEAILNGDPHVKSAVMFGRGRFNPGVIIDPKPEFAFDPEDQGKSAEFRNAIWCVDHGSSYHQPESSIKVLFLDRGLPDHGPSCAGQRSNG